MTAEGTKDQPTTIILEQQIIRGARDSVGIASYRLHMRGNLLEKAIARLGEQQIEVNVHETNDLSELARINRKQEYIRELAEAGGVNLPSEPVEGIVAGETEKGDVLVIWSQLLRKSLEIKSRLRQADEFNERLRLLRAINTILTHQENTLTTLTHVWELPLTDLVTFALQVTKDTENKMGSESRKQEIRLTIRKILEGGPQVKTVLRNKLRENLHYRLDEVNAALLELLRGDEEIEAGWCTNPFAITHNIIRAGEIWMLKGTPIPASTLFFKGLTKTEAAELIRDRLLEVIPEEGAPAPEIARRYREIYGYEPPTLHGFLGTLLYQKQIEEVRKGRSYFSKGTIYKRIHHEDA